MMIDVLKQHLEGTPSKCATGKWLAEQEAEIQDAFASLSTRGNINMTSLYQGLSQYDIPFGITTFKSHLKGTCTCQH